MSFSVPMPSAGPSAAPLSTAITVVSSQFLASYPVNLYISEKLVTIKEGAFTVTDVDGKDMFTVEGSFFSLHDTRRLLDSSGTPILTFRQKVHYILSTLSVHLIFLYTVTYCTIFQSSIKRTIEFKIYPYSPDWHTLDLILICAIPSHNPSWVPYFHYDYISPNVIQFRLLRYIGDGKYIEEIARTAKIYFSVPRSRGLSNLRLN